MTTLANENSGIYIVQANTHRVKHNVLCRKHRWTLLKTYEVDAIDDNIVVIQIPTGGIH